MPTTMFVQHFPKRSQATKNTFISLRCNYLFGDNVFPCARRTKTQQTKADQLLTSSFTISDLVCSSVLWTWSSKNPTI